VTHLSTNSTEGSSVARPFRRSRVSVSRAPRRESLWLPFIPAIVSTSPTLAFALNAAADALRPFTVIRTHLEMMITSDQGAASESSGAAIGICVVSDQASGIGVTAVPTPVTDMGSDLFFLHQNMWQDFQLDTAVGFDANAGNRYTVDSKAMRRVNNDQDVVVTYEDFSGTAGQGALVAITGRMLIKLH